MGNSNSLGFCGTVMKPNRTNDRRDFQSGAEQQLRRVAFAAVSFSSKPVTRRHPHREIGRTHLPDRPALLTPKELQLVELLSYGYENGDIAEHFQTSRQAVKNMLRTINLKLGADNRTHAVSICFRKALLPLRSGDNDPGFCPPLTHGGSAK